jgi:hypothetical protein
VKTLSTAGIRSPPIVVFSILVHAPINHKKNIMGAAQRIIFSKFTKEKI